MARFIRTLKNSPITPATLQLFLVLVCFTVLSATEHPQKIAGARAEILSQAVQQVDALARQSLDLEVFGKRTVEFSAPFLDYKENALPLLQQTALSAYKNWKTRYWALDLLGALGNSESEKTLLSILSSEHSKVELREKSLEALQELNARKILWAPISTQEQLKKISRRTKSATLNQKIEAALKGWKSQ